MESADAGAAVAREPVVASPRRGVSACRNSSTAARGDERKVRSMRVLTVYAHPSPRSFCHAVLERFGQGLEDAGHACERLRKVDAPLRVAHRVAVEHVDRRRNVELRTFAARRGDDYLLERGLLRAGRLAGIDFGEKRIGVAVCDGDQKIASPLETHHRQSDAADRAYFHQLAKDYQLVGFVVGLPVHASGEESAGSQKCRSFGEWLSRATGLPVAFFDERYTSAQADSLMAGVGFTRRQKKDRRDMLARYLADHGVGTVVQWGGQPIHSIPELEVRGQAPHTREIFERCLLLPMNPLMSNHDVDHVITLIQELYGVA